jgi:hypothetical protein
MMSYTAGMKKRLTMRKTPSTEYVSIGALVYIAFLDERDISMVMCPYPVGLGVHRHQFKIISLTRSGF